ncbi:PASTA domain-containing protein [Phycicoccus sp. Soil802]|uniref:PASTA domain-containing protein n=1 Tax=Phycicoccus sp. Soil802 TaxID=1736414 RepID=UPI00138F1FD4|nr:PASTA domain-containing protein [Phycicoccus sp. Soil802]
MAMLLANCSGEPVPVPNVVGIRLDDAHNALAAKGFEDFEDLDMFDDRAILIDSNWVVLQQDPNPNQETDRGGTVSLRVGKIGEARTRRALPSGSPVLAEILAKEKAAADERARRAVADAKRAADQKSADAAKQAARAKARTAAAAKYVNSIDPALRLGLTNHRELARLRGQVQNRQVTGEMLTDNVAAATTALKLLSTILESSKPSEEANLGQEHQRLESAVDAFGQAAMTLLSADGPDADAALKRFDVVYAAARGDWNAALRSTYAVAKVAAPPVLR